MNAWLSHDTKQGRFGGRLIVLCTSAVVAAICACAAFLLLAADAAQRDPPPNTLWEVVHNLCVPAALDVFRPIGLLHQSSLAVELHERCDVYEAVGDGAFRIPALTAPSCEV